MKSFQERTEIIRGMIAQRMRQSPCSEDISFTTLQTWPELLIWGFPEGMIFNIIVSCDLELKKGYDLQQAIQAVESNEESQPHEFPDRHLINYIKYRLQKEYPQYVYLYNDSLLYSLKTSVEKGMGIKIPDSLPVSVTPEVPIAPVPKVGCDNKQLKKRNIYLYSALVISFSLAFIFICIQSCNRDKKDFQKIENTIYSFQYKDFIRKYPQSVYVERAYDGLLHIAKKEGIQSLQKFVRDYSGFDDHKKCVDYEGYKNHEGYKGSCPSHVELALLTIRDSSIRYFQKALYANTLDGWIAYRNKVPDSFKREYADSLIDQKRWEEALQLNTEEGYNAYISQYQYYSGGKYKKEAERKKIDLWVSSFFNPSKGKYETHPQIHKVNSYDVNKTTIVITNSTKYYLKIGFSGNESQIITLAPSHDTGVSLSNGEYRIVAANTESNNIMDILDRNKSTNNTDILDYKIFVGTANLSGGSYKGVYRPCVPKPKPKPQTPITIDGLFNRYNYPIFR